MENINLREKILDKIPEGLNELETIRFIHLELGKLLIYDKKWFTADRKSSITANRRAKILEREIDIENLSPEQICKGTAQISAILLNRVGIKAEVVQGGEGDYKHWYTKIHTAENGELVEDFIFMNDFFRIKKGFEPKGIMTLDYFNMKSDNKFSQDEVAKVREKMQKFAEKLKKVDEKLGFIKNGKYQEDIIYEEYKDKSFEEKINFIFSREIEDCGFEEGYRYIDVLKHIIGFSQEEKDRIRLSVLFKEKTEDVDVAAVYDVFNKNGTKTRFLICENQNPREVSNEEIEDLISDGLVPRRCKDVDGLHDVIFDLQHQIDSEVLPDIPSYEWSQGEYNLEEIFSDLKTSDVVAATRHFNMELARSKSQTSEKQQGVSK